MIGKLRGVGIKEICTLLMVGVSSSLTGSETAWQIVLHPSMAQDKAVQLVLADLTSIGLKSGFRFSSPHYKTLLPEQMVILGQRATKSLPTLLQQSKNKLSALTNPEGYEIITLGKGADQTVILAGGSPRGVVYGLYWLHDRLRVHHTIPEINIKKEPALPFRITRSMVANKGDIEKALRFGLNVVFGENVLNLVPWDAEPERTENIKKRELTKELIAYAHALHMKYLAFGTDFTYHPSLIREFGAALSPDDPAFWDAVQAKYRRLFQAMPELDGLANFLGEEQMYWGNYQTFDPIHDGLRCDWSLEKRYRTFIKKVQNVVAGEYNKLYFHITWDTNPFEQHAQPQIYKRIFNEQVPTKNLYLIPSSTQNDRWWFQAFNPTINLTPHQMMVIFETMDYHHGANMFPTFPGPYYQAWLQWALGAAESNLQGANADMPSSDDWSETRNLTAYTLYRLTWNMNEDLKEIARDYSAIYFGPDAAAGMAELLLLAPIAYKYGLYIEPVTYGQFTSLPHIRVGSFVIQGFPTIDKGKEHIEFLHKLYLRCKPWLNETLLYLDHGLRTAETMCQNYPSFSSSIKDPKMAAGVGHTLDMTRLLIHTNTLYVKTFFAYFQYLENPLPEQKNRLAEYGNQLKATRDQFTQVPGFGYDLAGVDQMLKNSESALLDLSRAKKELADAPTMAEIEKGVVQQQEKYAQVLLDQADRAVKFLHWEGRVDGIDILKIRGKSLEIEHVKWDGIYFKEQNFIAALPQQPVTVVPKDIDSRPMHPFVLEQPSAANEYTVKILLNDLPGGAGWCKFDLYFIPDAPAKLDLENPWEKQ